MGIRSSRRRAVDRTRFRYIVASLRPWNADLTQRLHRRTGLLFHSISDPGTLTFDALASLKPRYVFFPDWSHRIDERVFSNFECVMFHMTDVPFGRGGSPLQNLIVRGIRETKISALKCTEEIDGGPVYMKRSLTLDGSAEEIYLRASAIIEDMIVEIIETEPRPVAQRGKPTMFKRRTPDQGNIARVSTIEELYDIIRMLDADGYPHAFLEVGPLRFEFTRASKQASGIVADVRITASKCTR